VKKFWVLLGLVACTLPIWAEDVAFDFRGRLYEAHLVDNACARALLKRLPLMMSFEDFGKAERISYLKYALPFSGERKSYRPKKGDIAYWPPRRNITVFLGDATYEGQFVALGRVPEETLEMIRTSQSSVMTLVVKSR